MIRDCPRLSSAVRGTPRFLAALAGACALLGAGCGDAERSAIEVAASPGETISVELATDAASDALPAGAVVEGGRFTWTPGPEHEGEHQFSLDGGPDGSEPVTLVVTVGAEGSEAAPIQYGGCECGSSPKPPRPRGDAAAGLVVLAAWGLRRRAARA